MITGIVDCWPALFICWLMKPSWPVLGWGVNCTQSRVSEGQRWDQVLAGDACLYAASAGGGEVGGASAPWDDWDIPWLMSGGRSSDRVKNLFFSAGRLVRDWGKQGHSPACLPSPTTSHGLFSWKRADRIFGFCSKLIPLIRRLGCGFIHTWNSEVQLVGSGCDGSRA